MTQSGYVISTLFLPENIIFTFSIIFICIMGVHLASSKTDSAFKRFLPSLAVSIGVLGTFWGIFIGLSGFNPEKMAESIPAILNGMKTSFITSIMGMTGSIFLRIVYALSGSTKAAPHNDVLGCLRGIEAGIDLLDSDLKNINRKIDFSAVQAHMSYIEKSVKELSRTLDVNKGSSILKRDGFSRLQQGMDSLSHETKMIDYRLESLLSPSSNQSFTFQIDQLKNYIRSEIGALKTWLSRKAG